MKYKAFISYSRRDSKKAKWLHNSLETYIIPTKLREEKPSLPKKLGRFFKDNTELSVHEDLTEQLKEELRESDFLILICSTNSAQSTYVNDEIKYFKSLGKSKNIIPIIIDGEPNATTNENFDNRDECYPEALRFDVDENGEITKDPKNPIAPDIRKGKDSKNEAKIRIISKLLNVDYDVLWEREKKRVFRNRVIQAVIVACFILISYFGYIKYEELNRVRSSAHHINEITLKIYTYKNKIKDNSISLEKQKEYNLKLKILKTEKKVFEDLQKEYSQTNSEITKRAISIIQIEGIKGIEKANALLNDKSILKNINSQEENLASIYRIKAHIEKLRQNHKKAMKLYEKAILLKENVDLMIEYSNYAMEQKSLNKALNYNLKAQRILERIKTDKRIVDLYTLKSNLGNIYRLQVKNKESLEIYEKLYKDIKSNNFISNLEEDFYYKILSNISIAYQLNNKIEDAIKFQKKILKFFKNKNDKESQKIYIANLINLGNSYKDLKKYKYSIDYLESSFSKVEMLYKKNKSEWIESYLINSYNLTVSYKLSGKLDKATEIGEKTLPIMENLFNKNRDRWRILYSNFIFNIIDIYDRNKQFSNNIDIVRKGLVILLESYLKDKNDKWLYSYLKILHTLNNYYKEKLQLNKKIELELQALIHVREAYLINKKRWFSYYNYLFKRLIHSFELKNDDKNLLHYSRKHIDLLEEHLSYDNDENKKILIDYSDTYIKLIKSIKTVNDIKESIEFQEKTFSIFKKQYKLENNNQLYTYHFIVDSLLNSYYFLIKNNISMSNLRKKYFNMLEIMFDIDQRTNWVLYINEKDEKLSWTKEYFNNKLNEARAYSIKSEPKEAFPILVSSLVLIEGLKKEIREQLPQQYIQNMANLGITYCELGEKEAGVKLLKKALKVISLYYNKNKTFWREEYLRIIDSLFIENSKNFTELINLSNIELNIIRDSYKENEIKWFQKYVNGLHNLSVSYFKMKKYNKALSLMNEKSDILKNQYDSNHSIVKKNIEYIELIKRKIEHKSE